MSVIKENYYSGSSAPYERAHLNASATRMRNLADDDYIDARTLYRYERYRGFVYHASQSVEKYLKSILWFLEKKAHKTHDLKYLYESVIKYSDMDLKNRSIDFIRELNGLGAAVRYDDIPYYVRYEILHDLDFFIRDIRPFCKCRALPDVIFNKAPSLTSLRLISGHDLKTSQIHFDGKLEKLIKSSNKRDKISRSNLIWNNPFFYKIKRNKFIVKYGGWSVNARTGSSGDPQDKKIYDYLKNFI